MPSNPWKKFRAGGGGGGGGGVSRLLAELRPPEQGGSLVVQTGFPTSLADLVVKNRGRLKKPSRKKKLPPSDLDSSVATPVVATPSDDGARPGAAFVNRPAPVTECGRSSSLISTETDKKRLKTGLGFLLAMMSVLVLLAIERKKLVVGITVSAFALRLLDSMSFRMLGFLKPCPEAKSRLNSVVVGGWDLEGRGVVSPIREVGISSSSDTVRSERNSVESIDLDPRRAVLLERRDLVGAGKACHEHDHRSKGNSKVKKLFGKFVPKKFRRRSDKKNAEELLSDSSGRGASNGITEIEEEEEAINGDDESDAVLGGGDVLSINAFNEVTDHDRKDVEFSRENLYESRSGSSHQLCFCAVVLLGLLGGKSVALVLTVSWFLFHKSIKTLWRKGTDLFV
ncbi:Ethylene-responsive nuclear protein [Musa troglodytarum]|uniref:Ethylene-responsive nuclear protein n=1 Tax=Musa troglodytarum TaxID=320322 RepID=A0A9E7KYA9_9LILI|nr:Ethylene-responsive nuclear protein [Musa troglodytarum]